MFHKVKEFFTHEDKKIRDDRWIFLSMLIGAILSLIASFVLSVEAIELAKNSNAVLSCNFNAVINCATVGNHPSAYMFGFPNSFLGLMAEPVVITVAIAGLSRIKFPRAFMFALTLLYISYNIIGALCPWCLLVTATTTFVWFAITRYNIRENNLYLSEKASKIAQKFVASDYDKLVLVGILVLLFVLVVVKYGAHLF